MAHGITNADGMAYVGRKPWHNRGTLVEGEAMTAQEAIEAANMDWRIITVPVYTDRLSFDPTAGDDLENPGMFEEVNGKVAIIREDTQEIFNVLSSKYTAVQNVDSFKFFDDIVGSGQATYHTAGTLWGGRRVWILAKIGNGEYQLDNGEQLESFVLLDNSHDGSSALRMRLTPVRVVCSNTLASATLSDASFYARHTGGIMGKVSEARDLLGLNKVFMDSFLEQCNQIASNAFSNWEMEKLTYKVLDLDREKPMSDQFGAKADSAHSIFGLFKSGVGNGGETRWDAYNAVTEFVDYSKGGKSSESVGSIEMEDVERRINSTWFGDGSKLRTKAWDILTLPDKKMAKALELK